MNDDLNQLIRLRLGIKMKKNEKMNRIKLQKKPDRADKFHDRCFGEMF